MMFVYPSGFFKRSTQRPFALPALLLLGIALSHAHGDPPSRRPDWKFLVSFQVDRPGPVTLDLSAMVLNASRPDLGDLVVDDPTGKEMSFVVLRATSPNELIRSPYSQLITPLPEATLLEVKTGSDAPLEGITLTSPAESYCKSILIEGSNDGRTWKILAKNRPVFQQIDGTFQPSIFFPATRCRQLRVTVNDRKSPPVIWTGIDLHFLPNHPVPPETIPATILEQREIPGQTRLLLDLGAANLPLASMTFDPKNALSPREINVSTWNMSLEAGRADLRETPLSRGTIHHLAGFESHPSDLKIPIHSTSPSRELLVFIDNRGSAPLHLNPIRIQRHPVWIMFQAPQAGRYTLATGHPLHSKSHRVEPLDQTPSPRPSLNIHDLQPNPSHTADTPIVGIPATGNPIDLSLWKFRKKVMVTQPGLQELELDHDLLAGTQLDHADACVVHDGLQYPFVYEHSSNTRSLIPPATRVPDPGHPNISLWKIRLPLPNFPVRWISFDSPATAFQRRITLYNWQPDAQGKLERHNLNQALWNREPGKPQKPLALNLKSYVSSDTLWLEIQNEDQPPIPLTNFEVHYPRYRFFFVAPHTGTTWIYYGHPSPPIPRDNLHQMASQILSARKSIARVGPEEALHPPSPPPTTPLAFSTPLHPHFWMTLALVSSILIWIFFKYQRK